MYIETNFPVYSGGTGVEKVQIGAITNAVTAKVTVKDFSDPTLYMSVPYTDEYKDLLQVENYVAVKEGESNIWIQNDKPINFYINKTKLSTKNRTIEVWGEIEENYLRNSLNVEPLLVGNGSLGFNQLLTVHAWRPRGADPFPEMINNIDTTVTGTATGFWRSPSLTIWSVLDAMKGKEGSFIDTYGGKLWKRNGRIQWEKPNLAVLGRDNGVRVEYGKNITGIDVEVDISDVVNGVVHFAHKEGRENNWFTPDMIFGKLGEVHDEIYSLGSKVWKNGRIEYVDWSNSDPRPKTRDDIHALALPWNNANKQLNDPKTSVKIDFISLRHAKGYEEYQELESLGLGHVVRVYYKPLNIEIKAEVVSYEYNAITDRYDKLEIGNRKSNILNIINSVYRKR